MNAADELTQLYSQWRVLTEEEGLAIERCAWPAVEQCQSAKQRLQPRIAELSQALDPLVLEQSFRSIVDELVFQERRNGEQLRTRRESAEHEVLDCDRSTRSLRQLQKLYVPRARQNWQSYS